MLRATTVSGWSHVLGTSPATRCYQHLTADFHTGDHTSREAGMIEQYWGHSLNHNLGTPGFNLPETLGNSREALSVCPRFAIEASGAALQKWKWRFERFEPLRRDRLLRSAGSASTFEPRFHLRVRQTGGTRVLALPFAPDDPLFRGPIGLGIHSPKLGASKVPRMLGGCFGGRRGHASE